MISTDQLKSNNLKDVKKAPILENSFNVFPAFRKLYSFEFFCLFIVALQVWKP